MADFERSWQSIQTDIDTIVAIATPPGRGGVSLVRLSGPNSQKILNLITQRGIPAPKITKKKVEPRKAMLTTFFSQQGDTIDQGLILFFPGPNSFTGEDVAEFHGHGGPVVVDYLLDEIIKKGARLARPGEFSERAFLNGKIDLVQAEAIADLIDSGSRQAVKAAMGSLEGAFSKKIKELLDSLIYLRMYVEAAIDFPEEEVDFLKDKTITQNLEAIIKNIILIKEEAQQGRILKEGMTAVIVGKPNAGKSSLLNQLSGKDSAIVTKIPGTTRDLLREFININGMPLHLVDTAGLRESQDPIELEGVRRAHQEIEKADHLILVIDGSIEEIPSDSFKDYPEIIKGKSLTIIKNKIDVTNEEARIEAFNFDKKSLKKTKHKQAHQKSVVYVSAKTGKGIPILKAHLEQVMGYDSNFEGKFLARRRHLQALERALDAVVTGKRQLETQRAGELLAEDLRQAQLALAEITGEFTSEDLLGKIFSSFCIGK